MDRRAFIWGAGTSSLMLAAGVRRASAGAGAHAPSAPGKPLRLACPGAPGATGGLCDDARRISREITAILSPGRSVLSVPCEPGGVISGAAADIYFGPDPIAEAWLRDLAPMAALPGRLGYDWSALTSWYGGGGAQTWKRIQLLQTGFIPLLAGHTGLAPALWSTAPLGSLGGLKIAASGLSRHVVAGLGAQAVDVPAAEIASALAQGAIDAAEIANFEEALSLRVPETARYCLEGALSAHGTPLMLGLNRRLWQAMTADVKDGLAARVRAFAQFEHARRIAARPAFRRALRETYDVQFTVWDEGQSLALQRISEAVVADLVGNAPAC